MGNRQLDGRERQAARRRQARAKTARAPSSPAGVERRVACADGCARAADRLTEQDRGATVSLRRAGPGVGSEACGARGSVDDDRGGGHGVRQRASAHSWSERTTTMRRRGSARVLGFHEERDASN